MFLSCLLAGVGAAQRRVGRLLRVNVRHLGRWATWSYSLAAGEHRVCLCVTNAPRAGGRGSGPVSPRAGARERVAFACCLDQLALLVVAGRNEASACVVWWTHRTPAICSAFGSSAQSSPQRSWPLRGREVATKLGLGYDGRLCTFAQISGADGTAQKRGRGAYPGSGEEGSGACVHTTHLAFCLRFTDSTGQPGSFWLNASLFNDFSSGRASGLPGNFLLHGPSFTVLC